MSRSTRRSSQPGERVRPTALPLRCRVCGEPHPPAPAAVCPQCLGPLDPTYPEGRSLPDRLEIADRPATMWRYREWLPLEGPLGRSLDIGFTPLVEAPLLARRLGLARVWVKDDTLSRPSLSFKDRVVATALNAADAFGLKTVACASTGNLANAVAAQAARAGLGAWIFIPADLEAGKLTATTVYGAHVLRIAGTYDDVNRICTQLADRFGWGFVNLNLRGYYGEGSKTLAFEIIEQLGWRLPDAVVAPMAGGSLVTKLRKGFQEFRDAGLVAGRQPRVYGAQAAGCAPIVNLVENGDRGIRPVRPRTIARSIAIGNPADGIFAAQSIRASGGWAVAVSDAALVDGIRLLAETAGVFGETAAGVTVAGAAELARAGHLSRADEVVVCITGNGLKTVEVLAGRPALADPVAPELSEVVARIEAVS